MYFEKVSFNEWYKSIKKYNAHLSEESIRKIYDDIKLPQASTQYAAGHDFYLPYEIECGEDASPVTIPTGIRWITEESDKDTFLLLCPRSGLGCKFGFRLVNTVGIVDADYYMSDNEGHILAIVQASSPCFLVRGERFMQGIILPYYRCGDSNTQIRNGGFGSTGAI